MKLSTDTTNSTKVCHAKYGDLIRSAEDGEYYLVSYLGLGKDVNKILEAKTEGLYFYSDYTTFINVVTGCRKQLNLSSRCYILKDAEITVRMGP